MVYGKKGRAKKTLPFFISGIIVEDRSKRMKAQKENWINKFFFEKNILQSLYDSPFPSLFIQKESLFPRIAIFLLSFFYF